MLARRMIKKFLAVLLLAFCSFTALAQVQDERTDYQLSPGDGIKILVFQNPELTLETQVTGQGTITFPLVGAVKIGGMSVADAEQAIAKALRDGGFVKQPYVNIVVTTRYGNSVSVLGQVMKPGRYPLETVTVRISEIIAMAGGIVPGGDDIAVLTGMRNGKTFRQEVDVAGMLLGANRLKDDVMVAHGDAIYVHRVPVFYIYGEVHKPGVYRVERGMTVRQALAQGGGPTTRGTERGMGLYRRGSGQAVGTKPDLSELVQPSDVFYIRETLF